MTIKPQHIQQHRRIITPEEYGGKAAGLQRLHWLNIPTYIAWVIPCEATFTRPDIDLTDMMAAASVMSSRVRWAVRSGAPVSMPGMMDTQLNVPHTRDAILSAVRKVWDSWDSPKAQAYRVARQIPNYGTGVVLQVMVRDIARAGVMFTCDPSRDSTEYRPIIEYVEGTGDALVSGKITPIRWKAPTVAEYYDPFSASYRNLKTWGGMIHNNYGPSDLEWVVDAGEGVWFVQHRPLKFSASGKTSAVPVGHTIAVGQSIGSPVSFSGRLTDGTLPPDGRVLYVREFRPEYFDSMLRAGAIVCREGGTTCHAAIIAREFGKPAVSGVRWDALSRWNDSPVMVDGQTGCVLVADTAETVKAGPVLVSTAEDLESRKPLEGLDWGPYASPKWNVNALFYRFYSAMDSHQRGNITTARRDHVAAEIARVLGTYLWGACLTEIRYVATAVNKDVHRLRFFRRMNRLGVRFKWAKENNTSTRVVARSDWASHFPAVKDVSHAAAHMKACMDGFNDLDWKAGGVGGPKWGTIARLAWQYFTGQLSPVLFCDATFNLQHNNGTTFGKFPWLEVSTNHLSAQLNARREGRINDIWFAGYTGPKSYATQESIFEQKEQNAANLTPIAA